MSASSRAARLRFARELAEELRGLPAFYSARSEITLNELVREAREAIERAVISTALAGSRNFKLSKNTLIVTLPLKKGKEPCATIS